MQIYIHRNNEDFGPYSREAVLEYIKQGVFQAEDYACYAGMSEWKTISELLALEDPSAPSRPATTPGSASASPSRQMRATTPIAQRGAQLRRSTRPVAEKKRGGMIVLNLILIVIVAIGAYIRFGGGADKFHAVLATNSGAEATSAPAIDASPAPQPAATPERVVATPPPMVAAATPAPPKPFDPADLAAYPNAWPKTVLIKQPATFPALLNGQVVGSVDLPAGSEVNLVKINGDQLTLEHLGATQQISWKLTDLGEQIAKSGWVVPNAPAAVPATAAVPVAPAATGSAPAASNVTATATEPAPTGN